MNAFDHIDNLGRKAKDRVTGFSGVITSISFDLYGCVEYVVSPPTDDKGEHKDGRWFDSHRLAIRKAKPVMSIPEEFVEKKEIKIKGPAEKPIKVRPQKG